MGGHFTILKGTHFVIKENDKDSKVLLSVRHLSQWLSNTGINIYKTIAHTHIHLHMETNTYTYSCILKLKCLFKLTFCWQSDKPANYKNKNQCKQNVFFFNYLK